MSNNITNTVIFLKQSTINLTCKKEFPVRAGWKQSRPSEIHKINEHI